jgi:UDPglucose 6-dehydrogenase
VKALMRTAEDFGEPLQILRAVEAVNEAQKQVLAQKIVTRFGSDLTGRTFGLWGLAFKPNTDDMREAPSRTLIAELLARGARVQAYDPVAVKEAQRVLEMDLQKTPEQLERLVYANDAMEAAKGADALVVATEWKVFKAPDFETLKAQLKTPIVFDGRNLYEPLTLQELGIEYHAVGRASAAQASRARAEAATSTQSQVTA